ncbi:MAG: DUF2993 domain-containing protein [Synergistetes bacterium]|nr:MAG: hypothetical protein XD52_1199 [bacterium 42_11]MBC7331523.1 DUF2993 domain-containing protein [Synergistota bacterium]MDK2870789.1 hypothetical protein [bacterium]
MIRKFFLLKFFIYITLILTQPFSFAQEKQSELLKVSLERLFCPKEMEFYAEPGSQSSFKKIYIKATNAIVSGLPLESAEIEAKHVTFNPPEEWKEGKIEVKKAEEVKLMMVITEANLNSFLQERIKKGKENNLKKAKVKIKKDILYVAASYQLDGIPLRILIELKSKIAIEGDKIILKDYKLHIGGFNPGNDFTENLISKVNPIFDLKNLPFPVKNAQIEQSDGKIVIKTQKLPQNPPLALRRSDNPNSPHVRD